MYKEEQKKDARFAGAAGIESMGGDAAAALKEKLGGTAMEFLKTRENAVGLGQALVELWNHSQDVEKQFAGVGQAALNLKSTFGEAEKEASKFMLAVQPATRFDGVARNFDAIVNGLVSLRSEALKANADLDTLIGENTQGMGTSTALLMGEDVFKAWDDVGKKNSEILKLEQEIGKTAEGPYKETLKANLIIKQGEYETLRKTLGEAINLNAEERKGLIDSLKGQELKFKKREKIDKAIMKRAKALDKSLTTGVALRRVQEAMDDKKIDNLKAQNEAIETAYQTALAATDPSEKQKEAILIYEATLKEIEEIEKRRVNKNVEIKEIALEGVKILQRQVA